MFSNFNWKFDMNTSLSLFKRINVVGTSGSGKSTFAKRLSEILQIPYIEMDVIYWKNDWVEPSDSEFFEKIAQATEGSSWVLDGNYNRSQDVKWKHVQTIIWLDYPFHLVFFRVLKRSICRLMDQKPMWNTNNKETFKKSFLSKDSIIWWMMTSYPRMKSRYSEIFESKTSSFNLIRIRNQRELDSFLKQIKSLKE